MPRLTISSDPHTPLSALSSSLHLKFDGRDGIFAAGTGNFTACRTQRFEAVDVEPYDDMRREFDRKFFQVSQH